MELPIFVFKSNNQFYIIKSHCQIAKVPLYQVLTSGYINQFKIPVATIVIFCGKVHL